MKQLYIDRLMSNFVFILSGHFLLLSPSPGAEASKRCEYHLTSPIMPKSAHQCVFHLALYETSPSAGNLTVLIKPLYSSSFTNIVVFKPERREDPRSENAMQSLFC